MKILFFGEVEDDVQFLNNILKAHFKKVHLVPARDQQQLIDVLSNDGPYGFCIIDCSHKDISPNVVYDTIIGFIGERPCLFMEPQAIVNGRVEQEMFERVESNDILVTPLDSNLDDLKAKITDCIKWAQDQENEQCIVDSKKDDFIGMKIKNFYLYNTFAYDLYVAVTSTKFLKAIMKNTHYTEGDIQRYVKKGVKRLYIRKDDQIKFLEESIQKCMEQIEILPISVELMKTHIIAFSVIQDYVSNFGVTESVQALTEKLIDSIPLLCQEKKLPEIVSEFPFGDAGVATKSVLVAYICDHMLMGMEWKARSSKAKMIISAILHDAFLENDDLSKISTLEDEDFEMMGTVERDEFINHPMKAARIANQFTGYSDIDYIIEQHHELPSGVGFPHGWSSMKLSILSCIFITSYNFTNICSDLELTPANVKKIIRYMSKSYNVGNFKDPMKILVDIFNVKI